MLSSIPLCSIKNASYSYLPGVNIFQDASLDIYQNDLITIIGPNGCGKSTFLKLVMGHYRPNEGTIEFNKDLLGENFIPAYVSQESTLFDWYTVRQNLDLVRKLSIIKQNIKNNLLEIIELLNINNYLDKYPFELSGGMLKKVMIARALIQGKKIVILDEALSSIDADMKHDLILTLKQYVSRHDQSIMMVNHDIEEVLSLANKVVVFNFIPNNSDPKLNPHSTILQIYKNINAENINDRHYLQFMFNHLLAKDYDNPADDLNIYNIDNSISGNKVIKYFSKYLQMYDKALFDMMLRNIAENIENNIYYSIFLNANNSYNQIEEFKKYILDKINEIISIDDYINNLTINVTIQTNIIQNINIMHAELEDDLPIQVIYNLLISNSFCFKSNTSKMSQYLSSLNPI